MTQETLTRKGKIRVSSNTLFGLGNGMNSNNFSDLIKQRILEPDLTTAEVSLRELGKQLDIFPDMTEDLKKIMLSFVANMPQLTTMNMEAMAGALMLLFKARGDISPNTFSNTTAVEIVKNLVPERGLTRPERVNATNRQLLTLFAYVTAINSYMVDIGLSFANPIIDPNLPSGIFIDEEEETDEFEQEFVG